MNVQSKHIQTTRVCQRATSLHFLKQLRVLETFENSMAAACHAEARLARQGENLMGLHRSHKQNITHHFLDCWTA